ncbi:Arabinan endo-1,5-alpha-L-arabinosidase A [Phytophthora fragariae]|nr:Arabinan endo-1,5-alpha-L-arabinosidase A [Phytophthora fragariae]
MAGKLSCLILLSLALTTTVINAYARPKLCTGTCTNAHDPSIIRRDDGTYFRFSTGGRIAIHTAPALTGPWTYKGAAVPAGSIINLNGKDDLWAPDVRKVDNWYYLYYSVSSFGTQNSAIGLARSRTMDVGTWADRGTTGIVSSSSKPYNAIDPNLIEVNGAYYLSFGSYWQGLYQTPMRDPPVMPSSSPYQIGFTGDYQVLEAAYVFHYGSYYYLFMSKGKCCNLDKSRPAAGKEYRILVCRSSSPTGGFVDQSGQDCRSGGGTVVRASEGYFYAPGGQGVYDDPTYGPVLYYHYVDTRVGYADGDKRFGWNTLDFSTGWPRISS